MISLPLWAVILIAAVAVIAVVTLTWAYLMAQRLHRMHKRCDQAALSLQAALERRALMARSTARAMRRASEADDCEPEVAERLLAQADSLRRAARHAAQVAHDSNSFLLACEDAENDLTLVLRRCDFSSVDWDDVADLQEARVTVSLARRFYNNAVHEALSLHNARLVRFFRLSGRAPLPTFFNIVDEEDCTAQNQSASSLTLFQ